MKHLSTLPHPETEALLALMDQFVTLWNRKDPAQFGTLFTEEAEFVDIVGQIARGRDAIVAQHRFPFAVVNKLAVLRLHELYMRPLAPHLVLISAHWVLNGSTTPDGKPLPPRAGVLQVICRCEQGDWQITLVHNTDTSGVPKGVPTTELRFFE
ncbi:conserved hypothetical protein [Catalinimonas alkaloidigena]|uniref:DUF4440 domain-containing protein n=1 Tax=Catalinimonas alkaloidigena TaxID=1075417 RepID=A0A1G9IZ08_9BACT|nr:SgcJ/EcaC family oxidoreductase [Catalinimonas alkaloidigena]SDL30499.1 conserved hypothetical protein [Catalinimonas alkaloidigena]